jgi:hypothetical protein
VWPHNAPDQKPAGDSVQISAYAPVFCILMLGGLFATDILVIDREQNRFDRRNVFDQCNDEYQLT